MDMKREVTFQIKASQVSSVSTSDISMSRLQKHHTGIFWRPVKKRVATATVIFFFFLLVTVLVFVGWIDASIFSGTSTEKQIQSATKKQEFPLKCTKGNQTQTCPSNYYPTTHNPTNPDRSSSNKTCPSHFRWIHEDLRHWKDTGITKDMVERARKTAHFRLVIVDGKAYVEKYRQSIQTRDMFSLWGILQLLRLYPGRLPDLDLMFDCNDRPVIRSKDFQGPNASPPPLFRYCSDGGSLDIVFPDWSFWGWAETNIRPWRSLLEDIKEGNKRSKWKERVPYAYWKGNPHVAPTRKDLLKCNVSNKDDWNTRLYTQCSNFRTGSQESKQGYKTIKVRKPMHSQAQAIGEAASNFIHEDLKMDYIYDYMFHLLNEYAKLLKFKPSIPPGAVELCSEIMACRAIGTWEKFMVESMVKSPSDSTPCTLPSPYDPSSLRGFLDRKDKSIKQVERWENEYWKNVNKKQ
uniref:Glycosyl transferase CAP10 domain-containing protein n=1 Tax=Fagus sylvatica TaxID=28930 RepID=A0A2N9GKX7_FAGSY